MIDALCVYQVCSKLFSLLYVYAVVPEKVVFNNVMTTLTSITISWTGPANDVAIVMEYQVQVTYNNSATTVNTTELMYTVEGLSPSTRVDFSVRAVSYCGQLGELSFTTEYAKSIRKSLRTMSYRKCTILLHVPDSKLS